MRRLFSVLVVLLFISYVLADPDSGLLQEGMKDYQQGNYEAAISKLKSVTEQSGSSEDKASAHLALGIIYQLLNDEEQARTQFAKAIIVNPNLKLDRDFYSAKTIELFDQARYEGLDRVKKGKSLYLEGKYEPAIEQISTGINLLLTTSPKIERHIIIDGYLTSAKIFQLMAKNDLAIAEFQKALQTNPELSLDPEMYSQSTMDLFQQAKSEGDRAVSKARELVAQNNFSDAIQLIEQNDSKYYTKTTRKEANYLLAEAYYSNKQTGRAETFAAAVLKMDPAYSPSSNASNTTFKNFFEDQRRKTNGEKNRVLIIRGANNPVHTLAIDGFKKEVSTAEIKETDASKAADAIKSFKPKVIFATGANSLQAVRKADKQVPVVFANVLKAEAGNLIDKNVGGIYWEVPTEAQFSFLFGVFPKGNRIGVVYNPDVSEVHLSEARAIAPKYGFDIVARTAKSSGQMEEILSDWEGIDILWVIPDKSLVNSPDVFRSVLSIATQKGLPVFAYHEAFVKEGALLSVSSDFSLMGKQAAELVEKLLDQKTGVNLPTLSPTLSKLAINLKTAKRLGIEIDPNVVTSAAVVYK
jgi:putative ABC transport system substrate-binding protein